MTSLPFHLYLNAFKNEQSLFMRSSRGTMRGADATANRWFRRRLRRHLNHRWGYQIFE